MLQEVSGWVIMTFNLFICFVLVMFGQSLLLYRLTTFAWIFPFDFLNYIIDMNNLLIWMLFLYNLLNFSSSFFILQRNFLYYIVHKVLLFNSSDIFIEFWCFPLGLCKTLSCASHCWLIIEFGISGL